VIEIDGGIHLASENKEYDMSRNVTLNEFGIKIIRFTNDEVMNELDRVTEEIKRIIEALKAKEIHKAS